MERSDRLTPEILKWVDECIAADPTWAKRYLIKVGLLLADGTPNPVYYDPDYDGN